MARTEWERRENEVIKYSGNVHNSTRDGNVAATQEGLQPGENNEEILKLTSAESVVAKA